MSRSLDDLAPEVRSRAHVALFNIEKALKPFGMMAMVIETRRTLPVQMAYFSRGRMAVDDVKAMYQAAGLYRLSDAEAKQSITWTLKSKHLDGLAIDIAPTKDGLNAFWPPAGSEVWEVMGKAGEDAGLKWGGRWKDKVDSPHFEL